jgi:Bacterial regulatory proteins, luxR family
LPASYSLSRKTVETYRERMMEKLGLHDFAGLIKFAVQHDVISLDQRSVRNCLTQVVGKGLQRVVRASGQIEAGHAAAPRCW